MFVFVNEKTAYEMRICGWGSTCALPISLYRPFRPARALVAQRTGADRGDRGDGGGVARRQSSGRRRRSDGFGPEPPLCRGGRGGISRCTGADVGKCRVDRRGRSEEHTSEIQSLMRISYAVLWL